jgi:hypothetical protein
MILLRYQMIIRDVNCNLNVHLIKKFPTHLTGFLLGAGLSVLILNYFRNSFITFNLFPLSSKVSSSQLSGLIIPGAAKTIHYANSISEFYLNKDKNSITELNYLPDGIIKEYKIQDSDIRLKKILQIPDVKK